MNRTVLRLATALTISTASLGAPLAHACDPIETAETESERLRALMAKSEAAYLDRNPVAAFYRGDFSDAGSLGDFSPASYETERAAAMCDIAALGTIDSAVIGTACGLGYLDFRFADWGWRDGRPALTKWFEGFNARPSMQSTMPA